MGRKDSGHILLILLAFHGQYSLPRPVGLHRCRRNGGFGLESSADIIGATILPQGSRTLAERVEDKVIRTVDEGGWFGRRRGSDDVEIGGELLAEDVERKIVNVVAEGIFDFGADGCDAVDDVGGDYGVLGWIALRVWNIR